MINLASQQTKNVSACTHSETSNLISEKKAEDKSSFGNQKKQEK